MAFRWRPARRRRGRRWLCIQGPVVWRPPAETAPRKVKSFIPNRPRRARTTPDRNDEVGRGAATAARAARRADTRSGRRRSRHRRLRPHPSGAGRPGKRTHPARLLTSPPGARSSRCPVRWICSLAAHGAGRKRDRAAATDPANPPALRSGGLDDGNGTRENRGPAGSAGPPDVRTRRGPTRWSARRSSWGTALAAYRAAIRRAHLSSTPTRPLRVGCAVARVRSARALAILLRRAARHVIEEIGQRRRYPMSPWLVEGLVSGATVSGHVQGGSRVVGRRGRVGQVGRGSSGGPGRSGRWFHARVPLPHGVPPTYCPHHPRALLFAFRLPDAGGVRARRIAVVHHAHWSPLATTSVKRHVTAVCRGLRRLCRRPWCPCRSGRSA